MIRALLLSLILFSGCSSFRPGFIHENSFTVIEGEALPGTFDDDGNYIPENPEIAWTYKVPDLASGAIFDIQSQKVSPSIQVELLEFDTHIPYLNTFKVDFGVAYQRAYIYVGHLFTNIFEISIGGWLGYNFEDREISYGIGFTIIKF